MITHPAIELLNEAEKGEKVIKTLFKRIDKLFRSSIIKYNDLFTFPDMLSVKLADGISTKKIPLPPNKGLLFQTNFQQNRELGSHKNDCYEHITVERGSFIDLTTGEIYAEGDEFGIKPGQTYNIKSLDRFTTIYNLFTRDAAY